MKSTRVLLYRLDEDGNPVPMDADQAKEWSEWYEKDPRRIVARTDLGGDRFVSTVFLGVDHNYRGEGPPVLWETMSFPEQEQQRYSSLEAAKLGHEAMVDRVRNGT